MTPIALEHYLILGALLFCVGAMGFMTRRNMIVALMSIELMLNAVNLTLVAFNRMYQQAHTGQMFTFFIVAVAAAEAAVGLSIVIALYRANKSIRTDQADQLKGLERWTRSFGSFRRSTSRCSPSSSGCRSSAPS